jgi:hypothetical protein
MVVDTTNAIAFTPVSKTKRAGSITKSPIATTATPKPVASTFFLALQHCESNKKLQKWIFQTDNINTDIIENNPLMT